MKPVSRYCASSDEDCSKCMLDGCNCACHKNTTVRPKWRETLAAYNKQVNLVVPLPSLHSYRVDVAPKELRETLCRVQSNVSHREWDIEKIPRDLANIQKLIDAIDLMRPLGANGKHGTLHTPYCGCEDK